MSRPVLLDLFCGAGGAGMGYAQAGWKVIGLDLKHQPRYMQQCVQGDALAPPFDLRSFDAIHASPPCQAYSRATAWRGSRARHPDLIDRVRDILEASGRPYVIETVQEGRRKLRHPFMFCGSMFGLRIQRHRYFEAPSLGVVLTPDCRHRPDDFAHDHGAKQTESVYRDAMGCDWMTCHEARQAIPPAYTRAIGHLLKESLK